MLERLLGSVKIQRGNKKRKNLCQFRSAEEGTAARSSCLLSEKFIP
jgi:hypothetical protein